jgi:hypothetical protein
MSAAVYDYFTERPVKCTIRLWAIARQLYLVLASVDIGIALGRYDHQPWASGLGVYHNGTMQVTLHSLG